MGKYKIRPKSPDSYSSMPRHFLANQLPRIKVFIAEFQFCELSEIWVLIYLKIPLKTSSYSSQRKIILTMLSFSSGNLGNFYQDSLIMSFNFLEITKHYRNMELRIGILTKRHKSGVDKICLTTSRKPFNLSNLVITFILHNMKINYQHCM